MSIKDYYYYKYLLIAAFTILSVVLSKQVVLADKIDNVNNEIQKQENNSSSSLMGNIKGSALLLFDGLEKINESAKTLKKSIMQIVNECSRKKMVAAASPNLLSKGVVIPPIPQPSGLIPLGNLPPRPKELHHYVYQIIYHCNLLSNAVDALILPSGLPPEKIKAWQKMHAAVEKMSTLSKQLKELVDESTYDSAQIIKEASLIYQQADIVSDLQKQLKK